MNIDNIEQWRTVSEFENYMVSNHGRIMNVKTKKIMKQRTDKHGYYRINLRKEKQCRTFFIHRLVAQAFVPNRHNKPFVTRIDGDKTNNHENNLIWASNL